MNKTIHTLRFLPVLCFLLFSVFALGQSTRPGIPFSLQPAFMQTEMQVEQQVPVQQVPIPNAQQLAKEDLANPGNVRFAAPVKVNYAQSNGEWTTLSNGDRIWRMELEARGALGLYVFYNEFHLPKGGLFYLYSADGKQIKGAYTHENNPKSGRFLMGMIRGEKALLEYYEPADVKGQGRFAISKVYFAYNQEKMNAPADQYQVKGTNGFGDALACHTNINCPEGANWQDHKRGVVRMLRVFEEGIGWCSGTLINNVRQDGTPYILSADHCYVTYVTVNGVTRPAIPMLDVWRFDFFYESPSCNNPTTEPAFGSMLGCDLIAHREETDFLLLELLTSVPPIANPYFVGWDRDSIALPQTSVGIHHPRGDIKKISTEIHPAKIKTTSTIWNNNVVTPPNHHLEVLFDDGTFEDGSSGSALLNPDGRIVGQLHGGISSCLTANGLYGRFALSWNAGATPAERLKEWLDPDNTGVTFLDSYAPPNYIRISGNVALDDGRPVAKTTLYLSGTINDTVETDATGNYFFDAPAGGNYSITARKNTDVLNGVSSQDMFLTNRHAIFFELFNDPIKELAADVNLSGNISAQDVVRISRVAIFVDSEFQSVDSWGFVAPTINLNVVSSTLTGVDFLAFKYGDVNNTVDPTR